MIFFTAAKEREKALKQEQQRKASIPSSSRGATPVASPSKGPKKTVTIGSSGSSTPLKSTTKNGMNQQDLDFAGLNLADNISHKQDIVELPKMNLTREKVLEEAKLALEAEGEKKGISLVVIGIISRTHRYCCCL